MLEAKMFVVTDDGQWVNEHYHRLAEIIQDYDPCLELQWIPPGQRTDEADKKNPYRIVDTRSDSVVMFASERDSAEEVLARLWGADNANGSVLDRMEARNNAAEAFNLKKKMEEDEMKRDFVDFLIGTKKNYIDVTHPVTGEKLKLDDQLRRR
jgi:hypothetical protein